MRMLIKDVTAILEELAPLDYAESYDNTGLLIGDPLAEVTGILVTLDTLEAVVAEAVKMKYNLIVSFHPIIFKGLRKLTGATYVERAVIMAVRNDIAIYSIHTGLDNALEGVNAKICEVLGLGKPKILIPREDTIRKLTTYVPTSESASLLNALFAAGAGSIGKYSNCSFSVEGIGSFLPGEGAHPVKGQKGALHLEPETQLHVTYARHLEGPVLKALFDSHPYEEVAYEVYTLNNANQNLGSGMIGHLEKAMDENDFLAMVSERMHARGIRHSPLLDRPVSKVAVLGGSGSFAISAAKAAGADFLITADIKYHQFYEAEDRIVIADIGHFETEQFTKNLLLDHLTKKMPNFAIALSATITNPIKYF